MPTLDRTTRPGSLRVSDAEREQVAARVRDAAAVGMLTLAEADERQAAAYAARIRADLAEFTDDLPAAPTRGPADLSVPLEPRVRRRLAVHAALAVVLAAVLIVRWALGPEPWFWPVGPMFWLALSVAFALPLGPPPPSAERDQPPLRRRRLTTGLVAGLADQARSRNGARPRRASPTGWSTRGAGCCWPSRNLRR